MFEFNKKKFNYDMVENQMVNRDMKVMENIPENLYPVRYATKHLKSNKNYKRRFWLLSDVKENGFSMLELLLYAGIVSILVIMAVPKYDSAIVTANTARVQADLQTLDSAIAMYYAENGDYPDEISKLKNYVKNIEAVTPPKGKININGEVKSMPAEVYNIKEDEAKLGSYGLNDFSNNKGMTVSSEKTS